MKIFTLIILLFSNVIYAKDSFFISYDLFSTAVDNGTTSYDLEFRVNNNITLSYFVFENDEDSPAGGGTSVATNRPEANFKMNGVAFNYYLKGLEQSSFYLSFGVAAASWELKAYGQTVTNNGAASVIEIGYRWFIPLNFFVDIRIGGVEDFVDRENVFSSGGNSWTVTGDDPQFASILLGYKF